MTLVRSGAIAVAVLLGGCSGDPDRELGAGGDPRRGRAALAEFECGVCHSIPGVPGAHNHVGPPLDSMARNVYIAGKFPNTPDVLVQWIVDAPALAPDTAMPSVGVPEHTARDMAAYLYSVD